MKNIFIGSSPLTSYAGYIVSGLIVLQELRQAGETDMVNILIAITIAILGRAANDGKKPPPSTAI